MDWVRFPLAWWYRATLGMSAAEKGAFMDLTVGALLDEQKGVSPLADKLLDDTALYFDKKRKAGRARWAAKQAEASAPASSSTPSDAQAPLSDAQHRLGTNERTNELTNEVSPPSGASIARADACAGEPPAPPAPSHVDAPPLPPNLSPDLADALAEAMRRAPLSPVDALDYAMGPHCGLTPAQVLDWANWNDERGWARDSGGALHALTVSDAKASMRRWKIRQPEIDQLKKQRGARGGDVTIPGVRVASNGETPGLDL